MARSTLVRTAVFGVALTLAVVQGCAMQGEGERCEPNAARNTDCDDGLICVADQELLDKTGADDFGRCCPPEGQAISDERCARAGLGGVAGSGGMSTAGGAGGDTSVAGAGGDVAGGAGGEVSVGGMSGGGAGGDAAVTAGAGGAGGTPAAGGAGGTPAAGGAGGTPSSGGAGGA